MENPSILSHVSVGTNNFEAAKAFYDKLLFPFGVKRIADYPTAVAYGKQFPEFWVHPPLNGEKAETGNGIHISFLIESKGGVNKFHKLALEAGGKNDGAPGPRELYGPEYYGCFIIDLDGHKIEAMYWDEEIKQ